LNQLSSLNLIRTAALATAVMLGGTAEASTIFGLTTTGNLVTFNSNNPGSVSTVGPISGTGGASLVGIDFRPATGQLYGLGADSRVYLIDPTTAAATAIGSAGQFTLNGTNFGVDFNPVPDRLRVVSDADQNLRINQLNGTLVNNAPDGNLAYAGAGQPNPNIVAAGYTNSVPGPVASTTLYVLDSERNALAIQNPPNDGVLGSVIGVTLNGQPLDFMALAGFDIEGGTNTAYASLNTGGPSTGLYTINLNTGAATFLGNIGGDVIADISVAPVPEPSTWALLLAGLASFGVLRCRRQ
jgi:hypothetical protein